MNDAPAFDDLDIGYDIPAKIGMREADVQTPCLIVDLDAFEHNLVKMQTECRTMDVALRPHGKMHKCPEVARRQIDAGAIGLCCQKVSEAEAFVRGGIKDILISNQVRDPLKIERMVKLPRLGARISCCVDDINNIEEISLAAQKHGTTIDIVAEIDCGAGRCGVSDLSQVVAIAKAAQKAPHVSFIGIQAYQGAAQHAATFNECREKINVAIAMAKEAITLLKKAGIDCPVVTGGGTGSYRNEGRSGVYTELQCGSYAFMDADYGRVSDEEGKRLDRGQWKNALFLLTSIMSHVKDNQAVCDAGLKVQSVDSGLPFVFDREDLDYVQATDEHGVITDPQGKLKINDKLRLVPGHCDPTCNIHEWYVGVRNGIVETLWPITARGKAY